MNILRGFTTASLNKWNEPKSNPDEHLKSNIFWKLYYNNKKRKRNEMHLGILLGGSGPTTDLSNLKSYCEFK